MTHAVHLSHVEFDIVWELLGLGERPYPITVGVFGETAAARAALREQVLRDLADRDLADGSELNPRLADLLTMLLRNRFTIDGRLVAAGHRRVLAAARGEAGLLAVQTGDQVHLEPVSGGTVVGAVVALLPEEKPGPGEPVTLPRALFTEAAQAYARGGYLGFERALRGGGIIGRDLRGLTTLVESGRHGGGQLAASSVDRLGRRTRSAVLTWFDTDAGRYLAYPERRNDGPEWLTCTPGDSARVRHRLTELVAAVAV